MCPEHVSDRHIQEEAANVNDFLLKRSSDISIETVHDPIICRLNDTGENGLTTTRLRIIPNGDPTEFAWIEGSAFEKPTLVFFYGSVPVKISDPKVVCADKTVTITNGDNTTRISFQIN